MERLSQKKPKKNQKKQKQQKKTKKKNKNKNNRKMNIPSHRIPFKPNITKSFTIDPQTERIHATLEPRPLPELCCVCLVVELSDNQSYEENAGCPHRHCKNCIGRCRYCICVICRQPNPTKAPSLKCGCNVHIACMSQTINGSCPWCPIPIQTRDVVNLPPGQLIYHPQVLLTSQPKIAPITPLDEYWIVKKRFTPYSFEKVSNVVACMAAGGVTLHALAQLGMTLDYLVRLPGMTPAIFLGRFMNVITFSTELKETPAHDFGCELMALKRQGMPLTMDDIVKHMQYAEPPSQNQPGCPQVNLQVLRYLGLDYDNMISLGLHPNHICGGKLGDAQAWIALWRTTEAEGHEYEALIRLPNAAEFLGRLGVFFSKNLRHLLGAQFTQSRQPVRPTNDDPSILNMTEQQQALLSAMMAFSPGKYAQNQNW